MTPDTWCPTVLSSLTGLADLVKQPLHPSPCQPGEPEHSPSSEGLNRGCPWGRGDLQAGGWLDTYSLRPCLSSQGSQPLLRREESIAHVTGGGLW